MAGKGSGKRLLLVVGMHRSGTSAVAGALAAAGVNFGARDELVEPVAGVNDQGFFEDREILRLHDQLLQELGSDWRTLAALPPDWQTGEAADRALAALVERLKDRPGELLGVKDPRLCLLLPLWLRVAKALQRTPVALQVLRHPEHVASSLSRRDQMPRAEALCLWFLHVLQMERNCRVLPTALLRYEQLLEAPEAVLQEATSGLGIRLPEPDAMVTAVSRELSHATGLPAVPPPALVSKLYAQLLRGADQAELDRLHDSWTGTGNLFAQLVETDRRRLLEVSEGMSQAVRMVEELQAQNRDLSEGMSQSHKVVEELQAQNRQLGDGMTTAQARVGELEAQRRYSRDFWRQDEQEDTRDDTRDEACYMTTIDLRVENNSHSKALRLLQEAPPGRVLEVGCAWGELGAVARSWGHEVWGVETSGRSAEVAEQRLDGVYRGTIEGFLVEHPDERFDHIMFGDVLEHLLSPTRVLRACARQLNPGGAIILSMPNVAHQSIRLMLLEGRFDYQPEGIMDETHLRFYTRDSIIDMLTESGLAIDHLDEVLLETPPPGDSHDPGLAQELENSVAPLLRDTDREVFQFICRARPPANGTDLPAWHRRFQRDQGPRILCLPPRPSGSLAQIRIEGPLRNFRRKHGGELRINAFGSINPRDLDWCTHVLLQRSAGPTEMKILCDLQALGKLVLFDLDDLLTDVPPYLITHKMSRANRHWLVAMLMQADAVTVSTYPLQHQLTQYNPRTFLVPNSATNFAPIRHTEGGEVRLLVASNDTVRVDFIVPALRRLKEMYGERLRLIGIGPPGEYLRKQGLEVEAHPNMEYDHFKAFLVAEDDTLGLIPLDDSKFNRCKSAVKFMDYAMAGVVSVCSRVTPYQEFVEDGVTGILCDNDTDACVEAVARLIDDAGLRSRLASAAREYCRKTAGVEVQVAAWRRVFDVLQGVQPKQGRVRHPLAHRYLNIGTFLYAWRLLRTQGLMALLRRVRQQLRR